MTGNAVPGLTEYLEWLEASGATPVTLRQRAGFYRRVVGLWGSLDVSPVEVTRWLGQFEGWTRRTYHGHLVSIFSWAVESGRLEVSPLARYRRPPTPRPKPKPLSADELTRALDTPDARLRAWILLGAFAGLRASEIAKVHGSEVTEDSIFVRGKGGRDAVLPTHPVLWRLAQDYPRDDWWFPSPQAGRDHVHMSLVSNMIRAHFRSIGITSGATHRLRYTYGTALARSGVRVRVVQELLRHGSLETTMRYVEVSEPELRTAIRSLPFGDAA